MIEDDAYYDIYSSCGLDDLTRPLQLLAPAPDDSDFYQMAPLHWAPRADASVGAAHRGTPGRTW